MNLREEIFSKELETLFSALPLPLFASWFNAMFMAWVLMDQVSMPFLLLWVGANTLLTFLRYASYIYYRRTAKINPLKKLYWIYFSGIAVSSLLWGSSSLFLLPDSLVHTLLVVFIAGGMAAGALGSVSYRFETYLFYNLAILIPFIVVLLLHSSHELNIMGFILILFSIMLLASSKKFHAHFHNALWLQLEQQELSRDLANDKSKIEKLNLKLQGEIIKKEAIQADLRSALDEAQQASKAKEIFFATISHELRTPLNAIIGFSQILLRKKDFPADFSSYMEKILTSGNHLLDLVNSILDFSKMRAGKMEANIAPFVLEDLLKDIYSIVEPLALKHSIRLSFPDAIAVTVHADRKMISQILLNLLSNAIKFSPEDSTVTLTYRQSDKHFFSVCDHGQGIDSEEIQTIFDPFIQLKRNVSEQQGTGLGLAIVKEMVQSHSGEIWVESDVGKGSCFYVTFPIDIAG